MTASSSEEAELISNSLLENRLIACSSTISDMNSAYWWKGEVQKENEILIIAKSQKSHLNEIIKSVKSLHSYDVPEILAIPIIGGNPDYLDWLIKETNTE